MDTSMLAQPATRLIECVSAAIGVLYEPTKLRRIAYAQSDIKIISAKADIQAKDISLRAAHRLAIQEIKYQENIESILANAIDNISDKDSFNEELDDDYIINFFDSCKNVTNPILQKIWGKILAESAASEDLVSKQTLDVLRILSQKDAEMFQSYASCLVILGGVHFRPKFKFTNTQLSEKGIHLGKVGHLDDLGLIRLDSVFYFSDNPVVIIENDDEYIVYAKSKFNLNGERLTLAGEQIIKAIGRVAEPQLFQNFVSFISPQCEFDTHDYYDT